MSEPKHRINQQELEELLAALGDAGKKAEVNLEALERLLGKGGDSK